LGKQAIKNLLPMQPGDVPDTYADVSDLVHDLGYKPSMLLEDGIKNFVEWYKNFYGIT
jgi:UDP-glucuronate 4-epimerase